MTAETASPSSCPGAGTAHMLHTDTPTTCPACGHSGPLRCHARRPAWWRDVPEAGRPRVRRGCIVRWRCMACLHTHARHPDWAEPTRRVTRALRDWLQQEADRGQALAQLARHCGLDDKTVRVMLKPRAQTQSRYPDSK